MILRVVAALPDARSIPYARWESLYLWIVSIVPVVTYRGTFNYSRSV
jgi:hypothetical protein